MGPRGGHGFHPYGGGPPRGAMRGQRGAFMSYPGEMVALTNFLHFHKIIHASFGQQ